MAGRLYIVATPIGNLQDITLRALKSLFSVDHIYAEEPTKTRTMLTAMRTEYPGITGEASSIPAISSLNEFEEQIKIPEVLLLLEEGRTVAYVSSAGTPLLSDPGYRLVLEAKKREILVIPIPGASAITTFLSAAGLPSDRFTFVGFPPKKSRKRSEFFQELKSGKFGSIVLYESPHRLIETLGVMLFTFGDINITIGRELTKVYEEIFSTSLSNVIEKYKNQPVKGEFVIGFKI